MKIVHLTSAHSAHDVRILYKESKTLAEAGYDVTLIAPHDGDRVIEGVQVCGIRKPRTRLGRVIQTVRDVYRRARGIEEATLYHIHDPELLPAGILLRLRGATVVYDAHENLPKNLEARYWLPSHFRKPVSRIFGYIERRFVAQMSGVVAATSSIRTRFAKFSIPVCVIRNFPIVEELVPPQDAPTYYDRPAQIAYVGGSSEIRGIVEMVSAIEQVNNDLDGHLAIAGRFQPPALKESVRQMKGWRYVQYYGWVDRKEVASILAHSRAGLVVLHPAPNHLESMPIKLFEYMAAGLPVIASDFPLWRDIIRGAECGLLVNPLDPEAVADAIKWILTHPEEAKAMGERGREAVLEKYNWKCESESLLSFYENLLA